MKFVRNLHFSHSVSSRAHIIMPILVEHGQYVRLVYAKKWRYCLNRNRQIAPWRFLIGPAFIFEKSHAILQSQENLSERREAMMSRKRRFYIDFLQQSRLANIRHLLPMPKVSFCHQASRRINAYTDSDLNPGWSLHPTSSSWCRSKAFHIFLVRKRSVRRIPFGRVGKNPRQPFDLSHAFRFLLPQALRGIRLTDLVGYLSFRVRLVLHRLNRIKLSIPQTC